MAKIAAVKNQAERNLLPLDAPKNTMTPDKNVNNDTVASKIIIRGKNSLASFEDSSGLAQELMPSGVSLEFRS